MTPEITELIKKKAGAYALKMYSSMEKEEWDAAEKAYADGQIEAIEMMIGFDNWLHLNYEPVEQDNYQGLYEEREKPFAKLYTRIDLLTKYINQTKYRE